LKFIILFSILFLIIEYIFNLFDSIKDEKFCSVSKFICCYCLLLICGDILAGKEINYFVDYCGKVCAHNNKTQNPNNSLNSNETEKNIISISIDEDKDTSPDELNENHQINFKTLFSG
jgi:hypothetical protein